MVVALLFAISCVRGQELAKHLVQRGETIEYIAWLYGLSTDDVKEANPGMDSFYTGVTLDIPLYKMNVGSNVASVANAISNGRFRAYRNDCVAADQLFEREDYKKAQRLYEQIISEYRSELPCSDAIYSNALCSYNRGKWKRAIEDLEVVVNDENCSNAQRDHCKQLMEKACRYREEQLENRTIFWSGLITDAAVVGTSVAMAASQSGASSVCGYGNGTLGEQAKGSSSGGESSKVRPSSSSSSFSSSSSSSCRSLRIANGKWYCANTGRCGMCNGDGLMDDGLKVNQFKCTLCGGTGKCKYCQ